MNLASPQVHAQFDALAQSPRAIKLTPEFLSFKAPVLFTEQHNIMSHEEPSPKIIEHCAGYERTGTVLTVMIDKEKSSFLLPKPYPRIHTGLLPFGAGRIM